MGIIRKRFDLSDTSSVNSLGKENKKNIEEIRMQLNERLAISQKINSIIDESGSDNIVNFYDYKYKK